MSDWQEEHSGRMISLVQFFFAIRSLRSCEVTLLNRANSASSCVLELVSEDRVFLELVRSNFGLINEIQEIVGHAFDSKLDHM